MEEFVEGYFTYIIYKNDNNFTVAVFLLNTTPEEEITVTGFLGELLTETPYRLHGNYKEHARYGLQFVVESYEQILPTDKDELVKYFSSALFPGIGKQAAEKVVNQIGENAIQILRDNPEMIHQLSGISDKQKESLKEGISNDIDDSVVFLTQHGVSARNIMKIEATYADKAIDIIKDNPYRLVSDIDGIGFKTADKLAEHLGFAKEDPKRIKAFITSSVLELCVKTGNSYESKEVITSYIMKYFPQLSIEDIEGFYSELQMEGEIVVEGNDIYHETQFSAENGIASFLYHFPYGFEKESTGANLEDEIESVSKQFHIVYDEKQVSAMKVFFEESFSILSGGPGTGKTTIVRAIIELYKRLYPMNKIALCAPTGRAAKRLSELSGISATTIHSLLKWDLETNSFGVDEKNPIEANLLVIDECSMVDAWLFYKLLSASKQITKILIIGDVDQLPSVGPGFVLKDLVEAEVFKMTMLDKVYRQAEGSDVIRLAHDIRHGNIDSLHEAKDVKMFECLNYQIKDQVVKIVENALQKGYNSYDVQVLAPMYRGVAGIDAMNRALQDLINPQNNDFEELQVGHKIFRENDKVLQLKNQPDDGVYNGDIGYIKEIEKVSGYGTNENIIVIDFDGIEVVYTADIFKNITHAYCISIHKSQGSEYPIVVMPIVKDYQYMLQRRLLYTGITRAKKSLVLLGSEEVFTRTIQSKERTPRETKLTQRIKQLWKL